MLTLLIFLILFLLSPFTDVLSAQTLRTGAERTEEYFPLLDKKRVALVVNQTAVVREPKTGHYIPLPDTLLRAGFDVKCIMAPEHGYKGTAEAGAHVANGRDNATGLTIYSLYGRDKKPRPEWLKDIDVVIFDIQDVGCRFYTYLSTLYYVLQACGEQGIRVIVLDRPNPNDYIDGPMLRKAYTSFVGIIPVPLMHGCTLGELARMMAGEGWLHPDKKDTSSHDQISIIPVQGWQHGMPYSLPIAPSLNLRNDHAIALYPSLCLFEGSEVSVGRGTDHPFEMFGTHDLRHTPAPKGFSLRFYLQHQQEKGWGWITRTKFFNLLAGSDELYQQLESGLTEEEIRASWQLDLDYFRTLRAFYALYPIQEETTH